jgi:hypothetical protein
MLICSSSGAQHRFVIRMWTAAGLCGLFAVGAAFIFRYFHLQGPLAYLTAVLPALPIIATLMATGSYLNEETDEFMRNVLVQSLLGGTGVTLAIATVWGYLEDFARAPRLDLIWVYPIFWVFVAVSLPIVRARYR